MPENKQILVRNIFEKERNKSIIVSIVLSLIGLMYTSFDFYVFAQININNWASSTATISSQR